jgi:hypothetical protein
VDSLQIHTDFNQGHYPVVDPKGRPFEPGCRVKFRIPTYFINTTSGSGVVQRFDVYGGCFLMVDDPIPQGYRRDGSYKMLTRLVYTSMADYKYVGPLAGKRVTERSLGDPHEHGTVRTYIEREDAS